MAHAARGRGDWQAKPTHDGVALEQVALRVTGNDSRTNATTTCEPTATSADS